VLESLRVIWAIDLVWNWNTRNQQARRYNERKIEDQFL